MYRLWTTIGLPVSLTSFPIRWAASSSMKRRRLGKAKSVATEQSDDEQAADLLALEQDARAVGEYAGVRVSAPCDVHGIVERCIGSQHLGEFLARGFGQASGMLMPWSLSTSAAMVA